MAGLICRHCGNTGIAWDTRQPCGCPAGKAYVHIEQCNEIEAQRIIVDSLIDAQEQQPAQADEPRAIIRHFAAAMERKLAANDGGKGGWRDEGTFRLWWLGDEEYSELRYALHEFINLEDQDAPEDVLAPARQAVLDEAADVANYLMMLVDAVGALPPTDERGR